MFLYYVKLEPTGFEGLRGYNEWCLCFWCIMPADRRLQQQKTPLYILKMIGSIF